MTKKDVAAQDPSSLNIIIEGNPWLLEKNIRLDASKNPESAGKQRWTHQVLILLGCPKSSVTELRSVLDASTSDQ